MTSDRRQRANRVNAKSSTGPKTEAGKTRASKNALRHGLNVSVFADPTVSPQVEAMAQKISGPDANVEALERARRIAEAQVDLLRVRDTRRRLITELFADPDYQSLRVLKQQVRLIKAVLRIKRRNHVRYFASGLDDMVHLKPLEGDDKLVVILKDRTRELEALDRYERRALSRRKFAIRNFDAAAKDCRQVLLDRGFAERVG